MKGLLHLGILHRFDWQRSTVPAFVRAPIDRHRSLLLFTARDDQF